MGTVASVSYSYMKRLINRYNAYHRALKLIESNKLPPAPSHFTPTVDVTKILESNPELRKELESLKKKDKNLDEHLKKVYLTSTSKNFSFDSKKPLPTKIIRTQPFSLLDIKCSPGCCTLPEISQMIAMNKEDSKKWNSTALAEKFQVDKDAVVNILMYYTFFKKENFDFINKAPNESTDTDKIEFEVYSQLEKKPMLPEKNQKLLERKKTK